MPTPPEVPRNAGVKGFWVMEIFSGNTHNCLLTEDRRVFCWGQNGGLQLGDGTTGNKFIPTEINTTSIFGTKTIAKLSVGSGHTCAITTNGILYCWGYSNSGRLGTGTVVDQSLPTLVDTSSIAGGTARFIEITAGTAQTCAITSDFIPYCWGWGAYAQLNNSPNFQNLLFPEVLNTANLSVI